MISSALSISAVLCAVSVSASEARAQTGDALPDLELRLDSAGARSSSMLSLEVALRTDDGAQLAGADVARSTDDARARRLRWWGRTLRWSTAVALVGTSTLGTIAAIDQPTAFGDGRCLTGRPVLGNYGCDRGLSTLHGASGVLSATLYTANGVLGLAAPESAGKVTASARPWHRALSYVHLGGIVVQPVIGLVSAFPQVIGKERTAPTDPFPRNLRTAHVFIGYVTTAAFLTTLVLER